jgi:hypothetical protein
MLFFGCGLWQSMVEGFDRFVVNDEDQLRAKDS